MVEWCSEKELPWLRRGRNRAGVPGASPPAAQDIVEALGVPAVQRSFWLQGPAGPLFATAFLPAGRVLAAAVEAPALGEDHLVATHTMTRLGRTLAERGVAYLRFHPRGCGESPGEESAATGDGFIADLAAARTWLGTSMPYAAVGVVALRMGAVLAAQSAARDAAWDFSCLIAPVLDGRGYVQQLLRSHLAGQMVRHGKVVVGRAELAAQIHAGEPLELEGHELSGRLLSDLEGWPMESGLDRLGRMLVLPFRGRSACPLPAESAALQAALPEGGLTVLEPITDMFWNDDQEGERIRHSALEEEICRWLIFP